jgi:hypothetical protein
MTLAAAALMCAAPIARADPDPPDPAPGPPPDPPAPAAPLVQQQLTPAAVLPALSILTAVPFLSPGGSNILICPGVGQEAYALGGYGGWCDFNFSTLGLHIHCEWGGFLSIGGGSNCWRVFPGYGDHPRQPDPQIWPDGWEPEPGGGGIRPVPGAPEPSEPAAPPLGVPIIHPGT